MSKKNNLSETTLENKLNNDFVLAGLCQCIKDYDIPLFKKILNEYIGLSKVDFAKKAGISKRTLFQILSSDGNPTIDKVGKLLKAINT